MEQRKIIQRLTDFFQRDTERVDGAILIGSFGRGEGSSSSDIDIELLVVEQNLHIDEFIRDVQDCFKDADETLIVKHVLWLANQRKLSLYHGSQLLLTELYLYTALPQFDKYFLGSRITDLSRCILVDRRGLLLPHLEHILTLPYDDRAGLIRELIGSIQFHLESTSTAARRHDAYKFYFLFNITLHELVRLSYVLDGNMAYNYNPPQSRVDADLLPSMDLSKSGVHLAKLIEFFLRQLDRTDGDNERARVFCADLRRRDLPHDT